MSDNLEKLLKQQRELKRRIRTARQKELLIALKPDKKMTDEFVLLWLKKHHQKMIADWESFTTKNAKKTDDK